jgi:putative aminopeptidase FrvX
MNIKLLQKLCETPGVPGREERVRELIKKEIKGLFDSVTTDAMGSLICTRKPMKPSRGKAKPKRVMIAAHMDEIGFYVRYIDDNGFLWINPAGGFDARNLFSRRVLVCCDDGDYPAVMNPGGKPIHIASPEERKKVPELNEFFVDLGMDADAVKKTVKIGDFIVMNEPFFEQPNTVVSKALDNRIACFVAIEAIRKIAKSKAATARHGCEIVVVFTVQEEVGLRGAITAANALGADIGIGLDTTLAVDTPGRTRQPARDQARRGRGHHGAGFFHDRRSPTHRGCLRGRRQEEDPLPALHPAPGRPGRRCDSAGGHGARTLAICAGTRYIHTVTESISKKDLQAQIDLLAAWLPHGVLMAVIGCRSSRNIAQRRHGQQPLRPRSGHQLLKQHRPQRRIVRALRVPLHAHVIRPVRRADRFNHAIVRHAYHLQ